MDRQLEGVFAGNDNGFIPGAGGGTIVIKILTRQ
jgi:hypothetical protein